MISSNSKIFTIPLSVFDVWACPQGSGFLLNLLCQTMTQKDTAAIPHATLRYPSVIDCKIKFHTTIVLPSAVEGLLKLKTNN
jgi:hypothetical protein